MDILKRLAARNRVADPDGAKQSLNSLIVKKIRARYDVDQELAIQRKRDTEPQEFAEYYAYVESCKAEAKAELGI
jgi:hypothetical protein